MRRVGWTLVLLLAVGCSSSDGGTPLEKCPKQATEEAWTADDLADADEAASECRSAGLSEDDCSPGGFISRRQALCVAASEGAPVTDSTMRVNVVFAAVTKRVIWNVDVQIDGGREHWAVDAISGALARHSISTSID